MNGRGASCGDRRRCKVMDSLIALQRRYGMREMQNRENVIRESGGDESEHLRV